MANIRDSTTYGIDQNTKNMTIDQYYQNVLDINQGNVEAIKTHFLSLGFTVSFPLVLKVNNSANNLTDVDKNEYYDKMALLSQHFMEKKITNISYSSDQFKESLELTLRYASCVVVIKYIDGQYGARFWQNVWARDARGTCLFIHPITNRVMVLSSKLPRGAEAVTGMVIKKNLETQDLKGHGYDILDDEQRDTCKRLHTDDEINAHLTSKSDGSLMVINCYQNIAIHIVNPIIQLFGSEYAKLWAIQSLKISNSKFLLVPATQGTFFESGYMAPYMVSSMLIGCSIATEEQLRKYCDSYLDAWKDFGETFIEKVIVTINTNFTKYVNNENAFSLMFEAICSNRLGLFGDRQHVELACSHDCYRLVFLGLSLAEPCLFIPHTVCEQNQFDEPIWWKIHHASTINDMLVAIEDLLFHRITKKEYFARFPPTNKNFDITNDKLIDNAIIDHEGWVLMKFASLSSTFERFTKYVKENIPIMIYSKIKTQAYYFSHKFHARNIDYLMKLFEVASDVFPLTKKVYTFCNADKLRDAFRKIFSPNELMCIFDFSKNSELMTLMANAFETSLKQAEEDIKNGQIVKIPKNPLIGFEKRPLDVKYKMALNLTNFDIGSILLTYFVKYFPDLNQDNSQFSDEEKNNRNCEVSNICKKITVSLEPWDLNKLHNNIDKITHTNQLIIELTNMCSF